jgi:hypothetical protein
LKIGFAIAATLSLIDDFLPLVMIVYLLLVGLPGIYMAVVGVSGSIDRSLEIARKLQGLSWLTCDFPNALLWVFTRAVSSRHDVQEYLRAAREP